MFCPQDEIHTSETFAVIQYLALGISSHSGLCVSRLGSHVLYPMYGERVGIPSLPFSGQHWFRKQSSKALSLGAVSCLQQTVALFSDQSL